MFLIYFLDYLIILNSNIFMFLIISIFIFKVLLLVYILFEILKLLFLYLITSIILIDCIFNFIIFYLTYFLINSFQLFV